MTNPSDWQRIPLAEVCELVEKLDPRKTPGMEFAYIDISSIDRQSKTITSPQRLRGENAPTRARQVVRTGDVLMSTVRPNLRTIGKVPGHLDGQIASTGFCVLRPSDRLLPGFLFQAVLDEDFQGRILAKARGVSYPAVRDPDILEEEIRLPRLDEQREIVARLETCSTAISSAERSLLSATSALQELELASLQAAFSGGIDSLDAEQVTLGELCDRVSGGVQTGPFGTQLHKSDYSDEGTPVVMPKDIEKGEIREASAARVDDVYVERLSRHKLVPGDIVQSRRGNLSKRAVVHDREAGWLCGTGCFVIRLGDIALAEFVAEHLNEPTTAAHLEEEAQGVTMPNLNRSILRAVRLRLPDEQGRAGVLDRLDLAKARSVRLAEDLDAPRQMAGELRRAILRDALGNRCDVAASSVALVAGGNLDQSPSAV